MRWIFSKFFLFPFKSLEFPRTIIKVLLVLSGIIGLHGNDFQCRFELAVFAPLAGIGCNAYEVRIRSRDDSIISSMNDKDLNSFSGANYVTISIKGQTCHFVPKFPNNFFPDLLTLKITDSNLKEIQKEDIAQFRKLKYLTLGENDLKSLPYDLFEENLNLEFISFYNNKLVHVGQGILTPTKKLEDILFGGNPCIMINIATRLALQSVIDALNSGCRNDTVDEAHKNKSISA